MAKFVYLYRGGSIPDELREQNMKDWMAWLDKVKSSGSLSEVGAPLETGKVVHADGSKTDFAWGDTDSNVGGWSVIEAESLDKAVDLLDGCPQLDQQYGGGSVEVRPVMEM